MVSDITYIPTDEGWLYLAGVMDLCGRKMIGVAMDSLQPGTFASLLKQGKGICGGEAMVVHGAVIIEQMAPNACKWSFNRWSMTLGR